MSFLSWFYRFTAFGFIGGSILLAVLNSTRFSGGLRPDRPPQAIEAAKQKGKAPGWALADPLLEAFEEDPQKNLFNPKRWQTAAQYACVLRAALVHAPQHIKPLGALLSNPSLPLSQRRTLALVLGSLSQEDQKGSLRPVAAAQEPLLEYLKSKDQEMGLTVWVIYALGSFKEQPDWHTRFSFPQDAPWVVHSPEGLSVSISHRIQEPQVLEVLRPFLGGHQPLAVRQAAVLALSGAIDSPKIRREMIALARSEAPQSDAVLRQHAMAALGGWLQEQPEGRKSALDVQNCLLEVAIEDVSAGIRLQAEEWVRGARLGPAQLSRMQRLVQKGSEVPLHLRLRAVRFLVQQLKYHPGDVRDLALLLEGAAAADQDHKIREYATRGLVHSGSARSLEVLRQNLLHDPDWNVRYAAAESIKKFPYQTLSEVNEVQKTLERAAYADPMPLVSDQARQALQDLTQAVPEASSP